MLIDASTLHEIDVCLVATRRPRLLEQTLRSFEASLFRNFRIKRIIANIDPAFGTEAEGEECAALVRSYDPDARIGMPERPGFAAAVASVWSASTANIILHLEDDWLLKRTVRPDHLQPFADYPWLGQISFNHAYKRWDIRQHGAFPYASLFIKLFGRKTRFGRRKQNFVTGPSFLRGSFAKTAASLMNPLLDPEGQFCRGLNAALERYVADFRNLVVGDVDAYYIEDLGRAWRAERSIEKLSVHGESRWIDPGGTISRPASIGSTPAGPLGGP